MARKKKEESSGGIAGWYATFGDLMNLLLCFFVLLFSMSNVDADKYEQVVASFANSFSIFSSGGSAVVGEGQMISSGATQLNALDEYFNDTGKNADGDDSDKYEELEKEKLAESEKMAENIEATAKANGINDQVEIDFNSQYVSLTLNGALLFDSGESKIKEEAIPIVSRIGDILLTYTDNIIEVEGHTDNVPIHNSKYENNNVLSTFRALSVAEYLIEEKGINPEYLKYSGRGEYVPVADNSTAEGRARNRRVEIKIYNDLSDY